MNELLISFVFPTTSSHAKPYSLGTTKALCLYLGTWLRLGKDCGLGKVLKKSKETWGRRQTCLLTLNWNHDLSLPQCFCCLNLTTSKTANPESCCDLRMVQNCRTSFTQYNVTAGHAQSSNSQFPSVSSIIYLGLAYYIRHCMTICFRRTCDFFSRAAFCNVLNPREQGNSS